MQPERLFAGYKNLEICGVARIEHPRLYVVVHPWSEEAFQVTRLLLVWSAHIYCCYSCLEIYMGEPRPALTIGDVVQHILVAVFAVMA